MNTVPVFDDRENTSHIIRIKSCRRINKVLFHLLKLPFKDCDGCLVAVDRRSNYERRNC